MHEKLSKNPTYAKKISRIRSRTVEPVLGTLINFTNMRRVNTRGMAGANKHVLMAALTYNLKKLMKFNRKSPQIAVQNLRKIETSGRTLQHLRNRFFHIPKQAQRTLFFSNNFCASQN